MNRAITELISSEKTILGVERISQIDLASKILEIAIKSDIEVGFGSCPIINSLYAYQKGLALIDPLDETYGLYNKLDKNYLSKFNIRLEVQHSRIAEFNEILQKYLDAKESELLKLGKVYIIGIQDLDNKKKLKKRQVLSSDIINPFDNDRISNLIFKLKTFDFKNYPTYGFSLNSGVSKKLFNLKDFDIKDLLTLRTAFSPDFLKSLNIYLNYRKEGMSYKVANTKITDFQSQKFLLNYSISTSKIFEILETIELTNNLKQNYDKY